MMKRKVAFVTLGLALSACVPPPPPAPAPRPVPAPVLPSPVQPAPQRPVGDWTDWPIAPGDWSYRADARGPVAAFGPVGANAAVTLRCDRQGRQIVLSRQGEGATRILLRSSSMLKEFAASAANGSPAYVTAAISADDPILDAIALSRGRFALEADPLPPLAIPSWPEIARVLEDCRG
jgi:hypothetical protein